MNRSAIEKYAREAQRDFISAIEACARALGIVNDNPKPVTIDGESVVINGIPRDKNIAYAYNKLVDMVNDQGLAQVIDEVAYTWFNRFIAIRFMEIQNWLRVSFHVLGGDAQTGLPEILSHISDISADELPNLDLERIRELRLAGNREEELYRLILVAQCNALYEFMPLLFEQVNDVTELLLPNNLLATTGLIRKLVTSIAEEDFADVEIIGWLYQYYIADRKDEVIGHIVATKDIPAATQLFTPNWIVQYMVQNTLGQMWLATYPTSDIKAEMPYYIEPACQRDDVQKQIAEITPQNLDPEKITFLDPACGSGHILVEAYNIFKRIYTERGFSKREIPHIILEKNLYGIDIDPRAAQLTQLALLMLARKDDRSILKEPPKMNIITHRSSKNAFKIFTLKTKYKIDRII